jgi:hypothetical protein
LSPQPGTDDLVWYVAYGSNMCAARFQCYLSGGRPSGGSRTYLGCRDTSPPRRDLGIHLPGGLVFAGASGVWGGGMAFFAPRADGQLAGRAYLITVGQLNDVAAQETWYETLLPLDDRDGLPMFTITSLEELEPTPPTAAYLRTVLAGLSETFSWTADERANYLLRAPGVAPAWTARSLVALCETAT